MSGNTVKNNYGTEQNYYVRRCSDGGQKFTVELYTSHLNPGSVQCLVSACVSSFIVPAHVRM